METIKNNKLSLTELLELIELIHIKFPNNTNKENLEYIKNKCNLNDSYKEIKQQLEFNLK